MKRIACLALACLLTMLTTAPAAPVDQEKIDAAIKKGTEFLSKYRPGDGGEKGADGHPVGLASLVGLAVLEGGGKTNDPNFIEIVRYVRTACLNMTKTYDIALAIVFLDRLNDGSDVSLIQVLGCRLLYGQDNSGGWAYPCWDVLPDNAAVASAVVPKDATFIRPGPKPDPKDPPAARPKLHPEAEKIAAAVKAGARFGNGANGGADNSNTQFAIVGLWVAQRRGVPCGTAFLALESRFIRTQSPADWGWGYGHGSSSSTPSMTCAGMLALAVAAARSEDIKAAQAEKAGAKPKKASDDDPFFNPPTGDKGNKDPDAADPEEDEDVVKQKKVNPIRDAAIERGLRALGGLLRGNPGGVSGAGMGGSGWGGVSDLYFIWSLERVAVGFGLETIGDVDWYAWGVNRILPSQQADGSWGGNYDPKVNSAFAILFLAKSNFVSDLTGKMRGKVKDPGERVLRGTKTGGLSAGGSVEAVRTPGAGDAGGGGGSEAELARVKAINASQKVADGLVNANDAQFAARLRAAKDTAGPQYTAGLVTALAKLEGKRQFQAREALADRLARMTPDTIRRMMADRDAELRRAAVLSCGMRDDRVLVRDLIDRLVDVDDAVVRAAKASLKSLTGQDHGPAAGADETRKADAQQAWLIWYATEGRGK